MNQRGTLRRRKSKRQNNVWLLFVAIAILSLVIASGVLAAQPQTIQPTGLIDPLLRNGALFG